MNLKFNYFSIIIICYGLLMIFVSCESHEQKNDDGFDRVKRGKRTSNDTIIITNVTVEEPAKRSIAKNEIQNEWLRYKVEIEKKIAANERVIKTLKAVQDSNAKLSRRLTTLEKDNDDFKRQMDEYNEEAKLNWENFKIKLNHDVNLIDIELKDIVVTNK